MNKIKLDLDALQVEQFETGSATPSIGTVRANATYAMDGCTAGPGKCGADGGSFPDDCDAETTGGGGAPTAAATCAQTCPQTCPVTCAPTCNFSVCPQVFTCDVNYFTCFNNC